MDATEVRDNIRKYRETGDVSYRNAVIERYMPLALRRASFYSWTDNHKWHQHNKDIRQIAFEFLTLACEKYDPARDSNPASMLIPWIEGGIKNYYRDTYAIIKIPRKVHAKMVKREMPYPVILSFNTTLSVASTQLDGDKDFTEVLGGDLDPDMEEIDDNVDLHRAIEQLPIQSQRALHLYYWKHQSQYQIAEALGISQMHVSRTLRKSLRQLRVILEGKDHEASDIAA